MEGALEKEGIEVLGWRQVPVDESVLGQIARKTLPTVEQLFVKVTTEQLGRNLGAKISTSVLSPLEQLCIKE